MAVLRLLILSLCVVSWATAVQPKPRFRGGDNAPTPYPNTAPAGAPNPTTTPPTSSTPPSQTGTTQPTAQTGTAPPPTAGAATLPTVPEAGATPPGTFAKFFPPAVVNTMREEWNRANKTADDLKYAQLHDINQAQEEATGLWNRLTGAIRTRLSSISQRVREAVREVVRRAHRRAVLTAPEVLYGDAAANRICQTVVTTNRQANRAEVPRTYDSIANRARAQGRPAPVGSFDPTDVDRIPYIGDFAYDEQNHIISVTVKAFCELEVPSSVTEAVQNSYPDLCTAAVEGIARQWSRCATFDGQAWYVNVSAVLVPENHQPHLSIDLEWTDDPDQARSYNLGQLDSDINLYFNRGAYSSWHSVGYGHAYTPPASFVSCLPQNLRPATVPTERFELTRMRMVCGHEFCHTVLRQAVGITFSWGHKGTSSIFGSIFRATPTYPTTGEIDMCAYFNGGFPTSWERIKASENDVARLLATATCHQYTPRERHAENGLNTKAHTLRLTKITCHDTTDWGEDEIFMWAKVDGSNSETYRLPGQGDIEVDTSGPKHERVLNFQIHFDRSVEIRVIEDDPCFNDELGVQRVPPSPGPVTLSFEEDGGHVVLEGEVL